MAEQKMIRVVTPEGQETIVPAANELAIREMYANYPVADQIKLKIEPYNVPVQAPVLNTATPTKAAEFQDELARLMEQRKQAKIPVVEKAKRKYTKKQTA